MISDFINDSMKQAKYEIIEDDNSIYWYIPGFDWVWANSDSLDSCREELQEILEEWLIIKLRKVKNIPETKIYNIKELVCQN